MIAFDFPAVLSEWPMLAKGAVLTLGLTAASGTIGLALGIACAWVRTHGGTASRTAVGAYVEAIRSSSSSSSCSSGCRAWASG